MAALRIKLVFSSSTISTDKLEFSVEKNVSVTGFMVNPSRNSFGFATPQTLTPETHSPAIVYVKNLDATNYIEVRETGGAVLARIPAGLFALIPVAANSVPQIIANTGACVAEYAVWTLA